MVVLFFRQLQTDLGVFLAIQVTSSSSQIQYIRYDGYSRDTKWTGTISATLPRFSHSLSSTVNQFRFNRGGGQECHFTRACVERNIRDI